MAHHLIFFNCSPLYETADIFCLVIMPAGGSYRTGHNTPMIYYIMFFD